MDNDLLDKVMAYEHERLIDRMARKMGIPHESGRALFNDTKKFLFVCGTIENMAFAPTEIIDECWHTFLLYTEDYEPFCKEYFGGFIHHCPLTPAEMATADGSMLRRTANTAEAMFGKQNLSDNWLYSGNPSSCGSRCGGSTGG
jgi:hypothetical protein